MDCGPTCLQIIAAYDGKNNPLGDTQKYQFLVRVYSYRESAIQPNPSDSEPPE